MIMSYSMALCIECEFPSQLFNSSGVGISKGRKCLRSRKCIVSTNYDNIYDLEIREINMYRIRYNITSFLVSRNISRKCGNSKPCKCLRSSDNNRPAIYDNHKATVNQEYNRKSTMSLSEYILFRCFNTNNHIMFPYISTE